MSPTCKLLTRKRPCSRHSTGYWPSGGRMPGRGSHARRSPVNHVRRYHPRTDGQEYKFAALKLEGFYGTFPGFEPTQDIRAQLHGEWIENEAGRGLYEGGDSGEDDPKRQQPIRPLTQELIDSVRLDVWPGMATITDFGIDSSSHLGALQYAVIYETATPEELDAAMGNGAELTEIARHGANPYRDVTFKTAWDGLTVEPESGPESLGDGKPPTPEEQKATFQEWREEAEQHQLHDRSVDFADRDSQAMLGEIIGGVADRGDERALPSDYQRALQNAIRQASYRTQEEQEKTL